MDNNCNHQNEVSNFCSQCGIALKEKCLECGQMEKIGRVVCETLLEKIYEERWKFISSHTKKLPHITFVKNTFLASLLALQIVIAFLAGIILLGHFLGWTKDFLFPYALWATLFFGIESWLSYKAIEQYSRDTKKRIAEGRKIATEKFLAENPGHAEILKQAEEDGNV